MINEIMMDYDGNFIIKQIEDMPEPNGTISADDPPEIQIGINANTDASASEEYFMYELNCDRKSYSIRAKDTESIPSVLTIPPTHNGLPVTAIHDNGFALCSQLSIVLFEEPCHIRTMGAYAFYRCINLESISLPKSIRQIYCGCFAFCSSLQQIYFNSKKPPVLEINVFQKTSEFLRLLVPECSLMDYRDALGWHKYCRLIIPSPGVTPSTLGYFRFVLNEDQSSYSVFAKAGIAMPLLLSIPWYYNQKPVTIIGSNAFSRIKVKEVVVSDTVETIASRAFQFNTTRYAPDYIYSESILEHVTFGKDSKLARIGISAFAGNLLLKEIMLPEAVSSIEENAFSYTGLTGLFIPKNVESIGSGLSYATLNLEHFAVDRCNQYYKDIDGVLYNKAVTRMIAYPLRKQDNSFSLPSSVSNFGDQIFWGFRYLRVLYLNSATPPEMLSDFENTLPSFTIYVPEESYEAYINAAGWDQYAYLIFKNSIIRNGLAVLGDELIQYVGTASEIMIPKNIAHIRDYALTSCSTVRAITVEEGNISYKAEDGALFNYNMTRLVNYPSARENMDFEIPDSVSSVGLAAFYDCEGPTVLNIHKQMEVIGDYAFSRCSNLSGIINLDGEDNLKRIGLASFLECTSIREVSFMAMQSAGASTFSLCSNLKSLTFGPDLIEFRGMFLSLVPNYVQLDLIIFAPTPPLPTWISNAGFKSIHVPAESLELYKSTPPWSIYQDRIFPLTIQIIR